MQSARFVLAERSAGFLPSFVTFVDTNIWLMHCTRTVLRFHRHVYYVTYLVICCPIMDGFMIRTQEGWAVRSLLCGVCVGAVQVHPHTHTPTHTRTQQTGRWFGRQCKGGSLIGERTLRRQTVIMKSGQACFFSSMPHSCVQKYWCPLNFFSASYWNFKRKHISTNPVL